MYTHYNHCHRATAHLQLNILLLLLLNLSVMPPKKVLSLFITMNFANVLQPHDSDQQQLCFDQHEAKSFSAFKVTSTQMKKNWEWSEKYAGVPWLTRELHFVDATWLSEKANINTFLCTEIRRRMHADYYNLSSVLCVLLQQSTLSS